MAKEHILFDKTEFLVMVTMGNSATMVNLKYDDIISISIKPFEEKTMFSKKASEIIEIKCKNRPMPITLTKMKEKKFWDNYKTGLKKFTKNNRISFTDETESGSEG